MQSNLQFKILVSHVVEQQARQLWWIC